MLQNRQALASRERAAAIQDRLKRLRLHFANGTAGKAYNSHICIGEEFIRKIEIDPDAIPGLSIKIDVEKISDESGSEITGGAAPSGAVSAAKSHVSTGTPDPAVGTQLRERATQAVTNNSAESDIKTHVSTGMPDPAAGTQLRERATQAVTNNSSGSDAGTHVSIGMPDPVAGTQLRERTTQAVTNNSAGSDAGTQVSTGMIESDYSESRTGIGSDTLKTVHISVSDTAASVNALKPVTNDSSRTVSNVSNKGSADSEMTKVLRGNKETLVHNSDIKKIDWAEFESPSAGTLEKSCISLTSERLSNAATETMHKPSAEYITHTVSDRRSYAEQHNRIVGETKTVKHRFVINMSGKVSAPGDFRVTLKVTCSDPYLGEIVVPLSVPVVFNADPRSLWISKPTSERVLFFKPDCDSAFVSGRSDNNSGRYMCMVAASQRGRQHAREGIARDDHFCIRKLDLDSWYIMVVADGAGSSKFSRKGSEVACNRAVNAVNMFMNSEEGKRLDDLCSRTNIDAEDPVLKERVRKLLFSAVKSAADEIHEIVNANANCNFKLNDFATTLLLAVFKHLEPDLMILSYAVGDGAMASVSESADRVKLLAVPDEGQYSGQTVFLTSVPIDYTSDGFISRCNINAVKDTDLVFLMTDGISDPMFEASACLNRCENWKSFLNKFRHGFPDDEIPGVVLKDKSDVKNELLKWLDFWVRGNHDDRTIAVMFSDEF